MEHFNFFLMSETRLPSEEHADDILYTPLSVRYITFIGDLKVLVINNNGKHLHHVLVLQGGLD